MRLPPLTARCGDVIENAFRGARRKFPVTIAIEHGADDVVFERLGERIDDGAVLDQAFDHPVVARIVDVDDADVTELAVDIADAGDRGAVVGLAAHEDDVARLKRQRGAVAVVGVVDQRIVDRPGEAAQQVAALARAGWPLAISPSMSET